MLISSFAENRIDAPTRSVARFASVSSRARVAGDSSANTVSRSPVFAACSMSRTAASGPGCVTRQLRPATAAASAIAASALATAATVERRDVSASATTSLPSRVEAELLVDLGHRALRDRARLRGARGEHLVDATGVRDQRRAPLDEPARSARSSSSASLPLQSTQPMPAVVQPWCIHSTTSGGDIALCIVPIVGQSSGFPGSSRLTRFSSVTARREQLAQRLVVAEHRERDVVAERLATSSPCRRARAASAGSSSAARTPGTPCRSDG